MLALWAVLRAFNALCAFVRVPARQFLLHCPGACIPVAVRFDRNDELISFLDRNDPLKCWLHNHCMALYSTDFTVVPNRNDSGINL
jgi:hypothetical protein